MLGNMKLGVRLGLGFGMVILLFIFSTVVGLKAMNNSAEGLDKLVNDRFPKTVWANNIIDAINVNARSLRNSLLVKGADEVQKELDRIPQQRKIVVENFDKLDKATTSEAGKAKLKVANDVSDTYYKDLDQFLQLQKAGKSAEAVEFMLTRLRKSQGAFDEALSDIIAYQTKIMEDEGKETAEETVAAERTLMIIAGVSLLLAALTAWWIIRSVLKQIGGEPNYAREIVARVSEGDLTVKLETKPNDTSSLLYAMKMMIAKLSQVVTDVNSGAQSLGSASEEVSATSQSLSQASSEQAASVEETSASIEQMTSSISQNTENAKVTDSMATKAAQEAAEGGEAVKATVSAMNQIAKKISIIDDIAYQTNLLALNAAIEAARAGEHGKGFAVVAAEVRKLAERSQVAAQEIGEVATSSVELAEKAGRLLDAMVPNIKKTSDLVQEITAASEEQSSGVTQINSAVSLLSQTTQQNASSSEELAATAEEMSSQAEQLQHTMSFFKLDSSAGARKAPVEKLHAGSIAKQQGKTAKAKATGNPALAHAGAPDEAHFTKF